ncbi:MAG: hypothetical protein APR54_01675 [Candidatus Cloacimonas sp. SDB]|nr:MAG: hypothetical protein APR54_01675 [Candidatus Cloacimonas sp. SDB]
MFIKRKISEKLKAIANSFPVITITGPRQSGKTTLTKMIFPGYKYVSLEDPNNRDFAANDPYGFINKYSNKTIIDEFQRVPELTSYLQGHIDDVNAPGMYILTGSNQFEYIRSVTQTLAGRTAIIKLLPFCIDEVNSVNNKTPDLYDVIVKGWYPRIYDQKLDHQIFYASYFDTYVQRDVRSISTVQNLSDFQNFVRLCAGRTGQILNYTNLANEVGVDKNTIKRWISILQASYIIELLQPYHKNFKKRIIKSPKLYFLDTGLACSLIGINESDNLQTHPLRGEIFETFVFSELLKSYYNRVLRSNFYFFRDSNNNEIDFLIENGSGFVAIEAKLNSTPRKIHFKNFEYFSQLTDNIKENILIYSGEENLKRYDTRILSFNSISDIVS